MNFIAFVVPASNIVTLIPGGMNWLSLVAALGSAAAWLYASRVKVSEEDARERTRKAAEKKGVKPNYAGMSFDGWDFRATLAAQAKWSSIGAVLAAVAVAAQVTSQIL